MTIPISPDGHHYLRMAAGHPAPRPYCYRWALPLLLGTRHANWQAATYASLATTPPLAAAYFSAMGLTGWRLAFATALLSVLPGIRLPAILPILTDAPAFALTLAVAALAAGGHPGIAAVLSCYLAPIRETSPVFAALWAWHPAPLAGLIVVRWWRPAPAPDPSEPWLLHPYRAAWELRRQIGLDGGLYIRPWGAALAGLAAPSWQMVATVAAAHLQLFAAVDTLRLAAWAGPVLVLGAAQTIPPAWWVVALVVTAVHRSNVP